MKMKRSYLGWTFELICIHVGAKSWIFFCLNKIIEICLEVSIYVCSSCHGATFWPWVAVTSANQGMKPWMLSIHQSLEMSERFPRTTVVYVCGFVCVCACIYVYMSQLTLPIIHTSAWIWLHGASIWLPLSYLPFNECILKDNQIEDGDMKVLPHLATLPILLLPSFHPDETPHFLSPW